MYEEYLMKYFITIQKEFEYVVFITEYKSL